MKKTILTLAAVLVAGSILAIEPVTLNGKFNIKKQKGTVALFSFDWSKTQVGSIDDGVFVNTPVPIDEYLQKQDEQKIAEGKAEDAKYVKDWPSIKQEAEENFKKTWNKEFKKGMHLTRNAAEAGYEIRFVIEGFDFGNIAGSVFGWGNAGGAIIKGYATLVEKASGAEVLHIDLNHVQGPGHFSDRIRTVLVLNELVDEIEDAY
ncbi:MAG: hypothetical protein IJ776_08945 [Paludibacteraceae bacterium]|nr:hypothetical protein [Paludibacteraceae bacterium]